jgi:DNA-binding beta-propeller fold protein YncE
MPANNVIGQRDFSSGGANTFNKPRGISIDADDQLYVADTGNNRIAIFPNVRVSGDNPPVLTSLTGLSAPIGVFIDLSTDEIWVTNTNGSPNQVLRYPKYSTVINNPSANGVISPVFGPIAVTVDPFSNPVVVEAFRKCC